MPGDSADLYRHRVRSAWLAAATVWAGAIALFLGLALWLRS